MPKKSNIPDSKLVELGEALNPKLTVKQKKFIYNYIKNNGNGTQAIKDSGYNPSSDNVANAMAVENLRKPIIAESIKEALINQGLTIESLTTDLQKTIKDGLGNKVTAKDSLKGIEMAFKLHGLLDSKKHVENKTLNISLKVKDAKDLKDLFIKPLTQD